jgi:hypothetical protein
MSSPLYRQIAEDLRRQVESGRLIPGQQLPTEIEWDMYRKSAAAERRYLSRRLAKVGGQAYPRPRRAGRSRPGPWSA